MNDLTIHPKETPEEFTAENIPVSAPAVSEQPDPAKELEAVRTGTVTISASDYTQNMKMAEEIGKFKMSRAISSGLRLGEIRWLGAMKENKAYQTFPLTKPNGSVYFAETFEDFCKGMGLSYRTVAESLQNYSMLGEEYLTEAQNLGLTVRDTRKIRKALKDAPEEEKREVFAKLRESTPEEMKTALDVICSRYIENKKALGKAKEEAADLKKKVEDLEKDRDAKQKVAQERNDQIAALKEELIVATSSAIADVEVKKMKKNANNREIIDEKCRDAVFAVANLAAFGASVLADDENSEETAAYVHERISSAVRGMAVHILSAGIDVDLTAELVPDFGPDVDGEPFLEADNQETTD